MLLMHVAIMPQFASAESLATHLCFVSSWLQYLGPSQSILEYFLVSQVVFILATNAVYLFSLLFRNVGMVASVLYFAEQHL